ncbi:MFS transporter [Streptosporangium sp. NPDC020072]|uniref:MFS transporter n=1 Tax=Streptosporangium sp. NPDC020072 TaxID=3154788 RepID=UPI003421042B
MDRPSRKWWMLAIVSAGFVAMTTNWFNIAAGFGQISETFQLDIPQVTLLISVFVIGYGVFHIPGGVLATRMGMRWVLALGLTVEGAAVILSATANDFATLLVFRVLCGVGASVFAAVGVAAVSVWFRNRHHALALGITSACFSVGSAAGLYTWRDLTDAFGWRTALVAGGALCVVVGVVTAAAFRVPADGDHLRGIRLTRAALRESLMNRGIWLYGAAFLGAYGAFIAGSQLIAGYGLDQRHVGAGEVALAAFLIGIAGVPGSVAGGWISDRLSSRRNVFVAAAVTEGVFVLLVPLSGPGWFWVPAMGVGFMFNFALAVWQTIPGDRPGLSQENIGTAFGLMLTISAVGGFALPYLFGELAPTAGYPLAWSVLGVLSIGCAFLAMLNGETRRTGRRNPPLPTASDA